MEDLTEWETNSAVTFNEAPDGDTADGLASSVCLTVFELKLRKMLIVKCDAVFLNTEHIPSNFCSALFSL